MKILIILPNDSLGGAEQYLKMVASYFKKCTVEVFFLQKSNKNGWGKSDEFIQLNYPEFNNKILSIIKFISHPKHKNTKNYDYIFTSHVYTTGLIGIMLRLGLIRSSNFIARESTSIFIRFKGLKLISYKLFYWLGYKKVDLLICQTKFMKDQLVKGFPGLENSTNIKVIPNPIDYSLIKAKEKLVSHEELPENFIVSAGRLINEKGYDILINAFSKLKTNFPSLKLVILGEGNLREELSNQVTTLNLQNEVILKGFVENVYPYFKSAKACVVSSRVEGFPNVLLQMMSQNSNVVSTTCAGGISEIPGIHISDTHNVNSLLNAITAALKSTTDNSILFDGYLNKRDISYFMAQINDNLNNDKKNN
mgnify:CR=1 FL=1|tara:strand:- start:20516 stop:21610 length:1095 start_codon:yes stop_codon:yes gene_type:complete